MLGGVGTRCDLPYDTVDELQLAVAAVLPSARDEETVVEIETGDAVTVTIGPVDRRHRPATPRCSGCSTASSTVSCR